MSNREIYDYLEENLVLQPKEIEIVHIAMEAKQDRMPPMIEKYAKEIWDLMYNEYWPRMNFRITDHVFDRLWDRMINEDKLGYIVRLTVEVGRQKHRKDIFVYGESIEILLPKLCAEVMRRHGKMSLTT